MNAPITDTARHYWRCKGCLAVVVTEETVARFKDYDGRYHFRTPNSFPCSCGSNYKHLGRVAANRLIQLEHKCPCDTRCTDATGPNCDCSCNGANHGTGRMVVVERSAGTPPPVNPPDAKSAARAQEFKQVLDEAHAAFKERFPKYNLEFMPRSLWEEARAWGGAIYHAKNLKIHKRRVTDLRELATALRAGDRRYA